MRNWSSPFCYRRPVWPFLLLWRWFSCWEKKTRKEIRRNHLSLIFLAIHLFIMQRQGEPAAARPAPPSRRSANFLCLFCFLRVYSILSSESATRFATLVRPFIVERSRKERHLFGLTTTLVRARRRCWKIERSARVCWLLPLSFIKIEPRIAIFLFFASLSLLLSSIFFFKDMHTFSKNTRTAPWRNS